MNQKSRSKSMKLSSRKKIFLSRKANSKRSENLYKHTTQKKCLFKDSKRITATKREKTAPKNRDS
jgi:hypothetical protein